MHTLVGLEYIGIHERLGISCLLVGEKDYLWQLAKYKIKRHIFYLCSFCIIYMTRRCFHDKSFKDLQWQIFLASIMFLHKINLRTLYKIINYLFPFNKFECQYNLQIFTKQNKIIQKIFRFPKKFKFQSLWILFIKKCRFGVFVIFSWIL